MDLTSTIALHAAKISIDMGIPLADSVMLATARVPYGLRMAASRGLKVAKGGQ